MASPYMARPFRYVGWWVVGVGAAAGVALGTSFPIGMIVAFAVGAGSAAIVHLLFGSPAGRLTLDQVAGALADLGVDATASARRRWSPAAWRVAFCGGAGRALAAGQDHGRDAWTVSCSPPSGPRVVPGRRAAPCPGSPPAGRAEAFVTLLAERAGVSVLPVVAAGMASQRDALLVTEITGRPLRRSIPTRSATSSCRAAGANAGSSTPWGSRIDGLDGARIVVRSDGATGLRRLGAGRRWPPTTTTSRSTAHGSWSRPRWPWGRNAPPRPRWPRSGATRSPRCSPWCSRRRLERPTRRAQGAGLGPRRPAEGLRRGVGRRAPEAAQLRRVSLQSIRRVLPHRAGRHCDHLHRGRRRGGQPDRRVQGADLEWLAAATLSRRSSRGPGRRHPRRLVPAAPLRAVLMLEYAIQFIALAVPARPPGSPSTCASSGATASRAAARSPSA